MASRRRPLATAGFILCGTWLLVHELLVLCGSHGDWALDGRGVHDGVLLAAAALCLWRAVAEPRERTAWGLIGLAVLAWSLGEVYYTGVLWDDPSPPLPSPADAGYLLFPVLSLPGLVCLLRARTRGVPRALWIDGVTAAFAVASLSAALVLQTVLDHLDGNPLAVATALAYPVSDLLLLGLLAGAIASSGWRLDRTWVLLAAGIAAFWLADSLYLVRTAAGTYESGGWFDVGWWAGLLTVAFAAWQPVPVRIARPAEDDLRLVLVPLGFGALALGVLVDAAASGGNATAVALAAGALLAVMGRLTFDFRDRVAMLRASREEALTDALTGLGNRRALGLALTERLGEGTPHVLVLFDLDGFKHYNDAFGHPAGDALLGRLGRMLEARVAGRGQAFRMGGDEFCALVELGGASVEACAADAAEALTERGDGFSVGCSYGAILLPQEAADPQEALRIADQRMYAHKHGRRAPASRQSAEVLKRALAERDGDLGGHSTEVAELAVAAGARLGLSVAELEELRDAAELHDIGKVAIPDAILSKPAALSEEEWAFMRRHTIIGERILLGAPALAGVGGLVRASHERWDGGGYPDGLRGEAIPLGARIVAVADAYDAMVAERPYREPLTSAAALAELRRCAGGQFDPSVVAAFCAAVTEGPARLAA